MIFAAALVAGAIAPAAEAGLSQRVATVASTFCIDLLSGAVAAPAVADEKTVFARYGLQPGVPKEAITALDTLGPDATSLLSNAVLASGKAQDGGYIVAVGGNAGSVCRIVVYSANGGTGLNTQVGVSLTAAERGWKPLPATPQPAAAYRQGFVKRDRKGAPFLANLAAPRDPAAVAMVISVAVIPPSVTLPQGF